MIIKCDENFCINVLNDSPNPIIVYDEKGILKFVNPAFTYLTGFEVQEVLDSVPPFVWWPDEDREKLITCFLNSIKNGNRNRALKFKTKWNKNIYVDAITSKANGNNQSISTWFDVTDEVIARQKIKLLLRNATMNLDNVYEIGR